MKKTLNINLAGYPFIIDEDAYNLLKDYLDTIRYAFRTNDDTAELANDIESRIAELLLEKEKGNVRIVNLEEVTNVIERIGKPSDFIEVTDEDETIDEDSRKQGQTENGEIIFSENIETINTKPNENPGQRSTPPPYDSNAYSRNPFVRKKLFRDPQNSMLGGVCSGLAVYLNIDVTIVRLIAVLLLFLSASTVAIVYIILWIVVPPADTPLQRMQMKGENPTMENIGKTVTETYQEANPDTAKTEVKKQGFLAGAMSVFVKCLIILGLIIMFPVLIVIGATLIGCMIAVFVIGIGIFSGGMFDSFNEGLMVLYILFAVIGGAITIGVPLWLLIRKMWKKDSPSNPSTQRSILVIWLCGIALTAVFTIKAVKQGRILDRENWGMKGLHIDTIEDDDFDEKEIENIDISPSGIKIEDKNGKTISITPQSVRVEKSVQSAKDSIENTTNVELIDSVAINIITNDTIK